MAVAALQISRDRLTALLKRSYELGCRGWLELADETAESLTAECIADISKLQKGDKTPHLARYTKKTPSSVPGSLSDGEFESQDDTQFQD